MNERNTNHQQRVLVVDDDKVLQQSLREVLEFNGFVVDIADNGKEAISAFMRTRPGLVVMDVNMPEMNGIEAMIEMKRIDPTVIVIIATAYSNVADAVRAVKEGAYNYLEKPITSDNLVALLKRALKAKSMVEALSFSAPVLSLGPGVGQDEFVGDSDEIRKVFVLIEKLSRVNTPVLIRGESGTGKELVARAIHFNGPRKDNKFVIINCSAIPSTLIESELFGHERGAFTGAVDRKIGKFQYADGGTVFLDEIGDISLPVQVRLLRLIQEKTFTPVGSNREIKVDVRIVAASNRPFEELIKKGKFREDLFYRLNVLPVFLPPLRERTADILPLVNYYLNYFNRIHNLQMRGLVPEVQQAFLKYAWPGNIRELRNVIEHAFIIESADFVTPSSLPEGIAMAAGKSASGNSPAADCFIDLHEIQNSVLDSMDTPSAAREGSVSGFQQAKDEFEKVFIIGALRANKGRINQTALRAGIPKKTLLRKIEKYEINPKNLPI
jgi:DNA-binding NtrC family response regulator